MSVDQTSKNDVIQEMEDSTDEVQIKYFGKTVCSSEVEVNILK